VSFILSIPIEVRLAILFVLGCCLGSLINLGVYSLVWNPRPISPWLRPPAEAPPRAVWDRLPVIGWFGLRREADLYGGGFWIWVRPMLVELFCGAAFAFLYVWEVKWRQLVPENVTLPPFFLPSKLPANVILAIIRHQQFVAHVVLFCFMLTAFWTDVDDTTIPDGITVPGTIFGLIIVAVWPYALLPQVNASGLVGLPAVSSVWLTSPDEVPQPVAFPPPPPRCVQPWDVPEVTCGGALAAGIAGFWIWCLALAPGHWSTRHGYLRAMRIFTARMVREPATYGLIALAAIGSIAIASVWWQGGPHWAGLVTGLAGLVVGGALAQIVRVVASHAMGREAMGFGDVTLLAMIGAYVGWQASIVVFFMAPLAALVFAIGRLVLRGEREIPYGPFLCLAAAITILFWPAIWSRFGEVYFSFGWKLIAVLLGCLCLMPVLLVPIRWISERMAPARSGE
jgi:prepilin signal peptidase PulO-like enzyme (type II secretory pathway)